MKITINKIWILHLQVYFFLDIYINTYKYELNIILLKLKA